MKTKNTSRFILMLTEEQNNKLQKESYKKLISKSAIIRQIMDKHKNTEKNYTGFYSDLVKQVGISCDAELYQRYRERYGKNLQGVLRTLIEMEL